MATISTTILKIWFNEFNAEYFDNKLSMPTLQVKTCKSYLGKCYPSRRLIIISNFYNRPAHDIRQTLIHEMIHLYNWYFDSKYIGHGIPFKRKAREINNKGDWGIARCCHITNEVKQTATAKSSKSVYAFAVNTHEHKGKLHFSLISHDAFESGKYKRTLEYFNSRGWQVSVFKTNTTHYPTARICRSQVHGDYRLIEDIQKDIDTRKLKPMDSSICTRAI